MTEIKLNIGEKIEFVEYAKILTVKDGDIIVLKTDQILTVDTIEYLKNSLSSSVKELGENIKVKIIILEQGMDIGVLRKGEP